jgi:hypothetical protein
MKIELDDEAVDGVVALRLREMYGDLQDGTVGLFSIDQKENDKEVKKMIKAIKRVHNFYSKPSEHL